MYAGRAWPLCALTLANLEQMTGYALYLSVLGRGNGALLMYPSGRVPTHCLWNMVSGMAARFPTITPPKPHLMASVSNDLGLT
jgi:hypothetical protein